MTTQTPSARRAALVRLVGSRVAGQRAVRPLLQRAPDPAAGAVAAAAVIRRGGTDPLHVLVFGGGALQRSGHRGHDAGLPGRLADALALSTGRGVDLDVAFEPDPTAPAAVTGLRALRLGRYEAVVVVLDAPGRASDDTYAWEAGAAAIVGLLEAEGAEAAALVVAGSSPVRAAAPGPLRSWTPGLDQRVAAVRTICDQADRVHFVALQAAAAEDLSGATADVLWADALVARMRPTLSAAASRVWFASARAFRATAEDERSRRNAVARMRLDRAARDEVLDEVVRRARHAFAVDAAAVHVLDGEELWSAATTAPERYAVPQSIVFCDTTIRADGLLLVNDTRSDPRFRDNPLTRGPDGVGFYAGHPIRSRDGYRIGTICITDGAPRTLQAADLEPLRALAAVVEQHLWSSTPR